MCLLEPITPITVTPNILSAEGDNQIVFQFESLFALLQAVSFMGNSHPTITDAFPVSRYPPGQESPSSSLISSSRIEHAKVKPGGIKQQLCSLFTFILGGPMPPTPGLIPLCWEDLVDWTDEATALTKSVYSGGTTVKITGASPSTSVLFVPYVLAHETDPALKKLPSQRYMERAQFYQESVRLVRLCISAAALFFLTIASFYITVHRSSSQ